MNEPLEVMTQEYHRIHQQVQNEMQTVFALLPTIKQAQAKAEAGAYQLKTLREAIVQLGDGDSSLPHCYVYALDKIISSNESQLESIRHAVGKATLR